MARAKQTLILTLMLMGGCLEKSVSISPSEGKDNVPVNVAIRYRYIGKGWINDSLINTSNFSLKTGSCEPASGQSPAPSSSPAPEASPSPAAASASASPVDGWVTFRWFDIARKHANGTVEKLKKTEVFFIPKPKSGDNPPLNADADYCFTVSQLKTILLDDTGKQTGQETVPEASTFFHTERDPKFYFASGSSATFIHPAKAEGAELSPYATIAFHSDLPVVPDDLIQGAKLCLEWTADQKQKQTTAEPDTDCVDGTEVSNPPIVLVESYPEEAAIVTTSFQTFGIGGKSVFIQGIFKRTWGKVAFTPGKDYTLNLGGNVLGGPIKFKVTDGTAGADAQLFKIGEENETLAGLLAEDPYKMPNTFIPFVDLTQTSSDTKK